ncbi:MAG: triose-phosphate isomerase [Thermodesulfobacteriota bacterium]|nr:triose-phosphate isomerase [Thermodesulfobacteriota bacterium]MEE2975298.1 triose-phosphate isomerase [Thermodesulfobacteriota bacterium]
MSKKKIVFANWKMNLDSESIISLVKEIDKNLENVDNVDIILAPSFPYLSLVSDLIKDTRINLSSQNVFYENTGPFTGEVSNLMLQDVGCTWAMIGHSERRQHLLETNEMINKKVLISTKNKLNIILCVGETFDERRQKKTFDRIADQLRRGLRDIKETELDRIVIGYEPIWVIGSGEAARVEDIQEVHNFIHNELNLMFPDSVNLPRIVYGGSVNQINIKPIASLENVDGVLIGNASMDCDKFCDIVFKVGNL